MDFEIKTSWVLFLVIILCKTIGIAVVTWLQIFGFLGILLAYYFIFMIIAIVVSVVTEKHKSDNE